MGSRRPCQRGATQSWGTREVQHGAERADDAAHSESVRPLVPRCPLGSRRSCVRPSRAPLHVSAGRRCHVEAPAGRCRGPPRADSRAAVCPASDPGCAERVVPVRRALRLRAHKSQWHGCDGGSRGRSCRLLGRPRRRTRGRGGSLGGTHPRPECDTRGWTGLVSARTCGRAHRHAVRTQRRRANSNALDAPSRRPVNGARPQPKLVPRRCPGLTLGLPPSA